MPVSPASSDGRSDPNGAPPQRALTRLAPVLITLAFAVSCAALLACHEMWRDELQAWLLARDSGSLMGLWRASRYEGHPLLWHLLLMPLAHAGAPPVAMQVLHWLIATAAAALIAARAPFSIPVRAALVLGYLPLYEYGAISRNYALSIAAIWAFCVLVRRRKWGAAAAGVVAANASPMGMLLGPALAGALVAGGRGRRGGRIWPAVVVLAGTVLAALQCLPPSDYEHARGWFFGWHGLRVVYVLRDFAAALLPLPEPGLHFWNSSLLFPSPLKGGALGLVGGLGGALVVAVFAAAVAWSVRRSRAALALWLLGAGALLAFAYVKLPGAALRHTGFLWVVAVAALWLAVAEGQLHRRRAALLLAPSLAAALLGTLVAARWDATAMFSGARCAARQLEAPRLAGLPLVGATDWAASGVAAYLPGRRLFYPAAGREGTYVVWNLARAKGEEMSTGQMLAEALRGDRGQGVVLLENHLIAAPQCEPVFVCAPTIVADESLWGYRCSGPPAADRAQLTTPRQ